MSIFDDARNGTLTGSSIDKYIKSNRNILKEQDPSTGWTPLATAVVAGFPKEVEQLLKKGSKSDERCRNDDTPLLLATWKAKQERPRIVQLLLAKIPATSVDITCNAAENKTPLMYAVENSDLDSIRLLRKAGASLKVKNDDGFNAEEMAKTMPDKAVALALYPDKEKSALGRLSSTVLSFIRYVVAWVNSAVNSLVRRATSGYDPALDPDINKAVTGSDQPTGTKDEFLKNVDQYVDNKPVLKRFFGNKPDFIKDLAKKAANLKEDPDTDLGDNDVFPKTVQVSLHQQVIYCDDSTSMKREGRWDNQKQLISRIAKITTLILPDGEGVALRFINRTVDNSSNLTLTQIGSIMDPMPWQPGGDTPIGTNLRAKILQPLVYDKIDAKDLQRPLLVSIITDGMPEPENKSELVNAILECGNRLEAASYPRDSVKFMIGQIGSASSATNFLDTLRSDPNIAKVAFVVSDKLDAKFNDFHQNDRQLDRWLIETLFEPLNAAETN